MDEIVYGKNVVIELLKSKYDVWEIYFEDSKSKKPFFKDIFSLIKTLQKNVSYKYISREKLTLLCKNSEHQGIAAKISGFNILTLDEYLNIIQNNKDDIFLFILDCIHDPHNVGAIIRSAYSLGASGCVIFNKRSAKINATVAKTSAGAVFHLNLILSIGIFDAIKKLKDNGFKVIGCDIKSDKNIYESKLYDGKVAVIISNEGEGITNKCKEKVDELVRIPMIAKFDSLNVSVTAGIVMYERMRQLLLQEKLK